MVLEQLGLAPEALTRKQRWMVLIAAVVVAFSRLLAVSRSLWDWDEALFSIAMRDYDVYHHHPHPPGFPLFVGMAKLVRFAVDSDFRALQTVTVLGALALFPAAFLLAREIRLRFDAAFITALLVAFLPNVWYFGGTAFSDVPALTLVLFACALLLRGCRDPRAYFAGAFVLAVAAGFRPQNLLVGLVPSLLATGFRIRQTRSIAQPVAAVVIGGVSLALAYGGAAWATGDFDVYVTAVRAHGDYIRNIDSFRSPERPTLPNLLDDFFIRPFHYVPINAPVTALAAIGLVAGLWRRRLPLLLILATFGPFAVAGWLMLDRHSTSRFSIGWTPMVAVCVAMGVVLIAQSLESLTRRRGVGAAVAGVLTLALVVLMASFTLPSLRRVRKNLSPSMQAVEWIQANVPPGSKLYVDHAMLPVAELFLTDYPQTIFSGEEPEAAAHQAWVLREGRSMRREAHTFAWRRDGLWNLARRRYFEVTVSPHDARMAFGPGWYGEETAGGVTWRWMAGASTLTIGATEEPGTLTLRASVPLDSLAGTPEIRFVLNGQVLEAVRATAPEIERAWPVPPLPSSRNEFRIETSEVLNPQRKGLADDSRDLGLRLDWIGWAPRKE